MNWSHQPLGNLLVQSGRDRARDRDFPVLSITMKHGLVDQSEKFKKRVASQDTSNYRVAYLNELVVGFPIDEGVLGFQTKYPAGIVSPAYDIWSLRDAPNTHIPYLERYLRSPQARSLYASKMQGAVARRRSLTNSDFLKLKIPFPAIDDQIRIAYLLGKVEGLIGQRKQHLEQLDELLKSAFLEMFGDPVRDEKGWKLTTIGDLVVEVKYGTSASAQGGQYKYLRMNNITQDGYWDFNSLKYIDVDEKDFDKYALKKGDLVFNRTNSKELVGKTAVYDRDEPVIIAGYLIRVRLNAQNNPWFVWGHLNSKFGKAKLLKLCRNIVGMANINAKELQAIPILQPPLDLQNQFAVIVEKVESIKTRYQKSLSQLENLYGALSQKAFKGEVDLSRVKMPDQQPNVAQEIAPLLTPEVSSMPVKLPEVAPIVLPDVADAKSLVHPDDRQAAITQWLEAYLDQVGNSGDFSLERFIAAVNQELQEVEIVQDGEAAPLNTADYEEIKAWVFAALTSGKLTQDFDDERNRITLRRAPPIAED